jgi:hypothetical protein
MLYLSSFHERIFLYICLGIQNFYYFFGGKAFYLYLTLTISSFLPILRRLKTPLLMDIRVPTIILIGNRSKG